MKSSTARIPDEQAPIPPRKAYSTPRLAPPQAVQLITITVAELRTLLRAEVHDVVAELLEAQRQPRALLSADELCEAIGISRPTLAKLLAAKLPFVWCGEHRRFELTAVLEHLRARDDDEEGED